MDRTVTITPELARSALSVAKGLQDGVDAVLSEAKAPAPLTPEEQLTAIADLRRELYWVEMQLLDAKEALESTRQWDEWQGLKEHRKEIQKKLDSALDRTMSLWSQPRML